MIKIIRFFILLIIIIFSSYCSTKQFNAKEHKSDLEVNKIQHSSMKLWHQKDVQQDSIPGISLNKWYGPNTTKQKKEDIIVAVIDSPLEIDHELLKDKIWSNKKEILNNGIDDDNNGYVDDINGWNFIGTKDGGYLVWDNFEYIRLLREKYAIKSEPLIFKNQNQQDEYLRIKRKFKKDSIYYDNWNKSLEFSLKMYPTAKDSLKHYFPKEDYTYHQLDSMYRKYKINDKTFRQRRLDNDVDLGAMVAFMKTRLDFGEKSLEDVLENYHEVDSVIKKCMSSDYDSRKFIRRTNTKLGVTYGNNNISKNSNGKKSTQSHATKVAGVVSFIAPMNTKIMPLVVAANGDEHDQDIALAIRYAVDNGVKIINMSFSKEFSLHNDLVYSAMKYAASKNVLIVRSAGNERLNVDVTLNFPNDVDYENPNEVVDNFINVGATTSKADSTLVASFSNYGKKNVDLFAPGDKIYTTTAGNSYGYDSGTSFSAPMVSGTAALIWSYYPKLSAKEVKEIILESGTAYDIEVLIPGGEGKKAKFSELSKSGKVLNAYNAMEMAEKVSKKKR